MATTVLKLKKAHIVKRLSLAILATLVLTACDTTSNDSSNNANVDSAVKTQHETQQTQASASTPVHTINSVPDDTQQDLSEQSITQPITILALGDSLTEGLGVDKDNNYPAQLQQHLQEAGYVNATVINSGLSGETSSGLVNRLDWVLKTKPDITILTTGANDAMRGIDVATVDSNIRKAISRLQAEGSVVILGGMQIYDNMGDEYVQEFTNIYPKIAEDTGVAFIPFFLEGVAGDATLNQADAIHPTSEGYTIIVNDNILPVLEPTLESIIAKKEVTQ